MIVRVREALEKKKFMALMSCVPRVPRPLRCSNQLIYEASPAENNSLACSCVPVRKR